MEKFFSKDCSGNKSVDVPIVLTETKCSHISVIVKKREANQTFEITAHTRYRYLPFDFFVSRDCPLEGLSHEIDFKNFDKNFQNLA